MTKPVDSTSHEQKYPRFTLGIWHGMGLGALAKNLRRNRFDFSWQRADRLLSILIASALNSVNNGADHLLYSRRVRGVEIQQPPLFIVGHWRTGTTLLHELLIRDPQFNYPSTYQCMSPGNFLLTERLLPPLLKSLLPRQRPMDNMPVGFQRPQEDEFALCNQGIPSPYLVWLYPDREGPYDNYLDLSELSAKEIAVWKAGFEKFIKRLTLRDPRALVLKSPTHTARIQTLLDMYPRARFIHVVRNPLVVIPSTLLMFRRMGEAMGIKVPVREDLADYVLQNFQRMYKSFEEQRIQIPSEHFFEVRFEDLTSDMLGTMENLYDHLSLGNFTSVRPRLEEYAQQNKGYQRNRFAEDRELMASIANTCGDYAERYGYEPKTASVDASGGSCH